MPHAGADRELAVRRRDLAQPVDAVDVDQMRRPRQPERHDRHQALAARQHAAIVGRDLRQRRDRLIDRLGRVIAKGGRLHRALTVGLSARELLRPIIWDYYYFLDSGTVFRICKVWRQSGARLARHRSSRMKPPPFSYHDPRTIDDVVGLLGRLDNAKLLAGGQSLMPMLNMRFVLPDHVIDLNQVEGLSFIRESNGALEIGAMTRQRDLEFSDLIRRRCPLMHEAILQVGHRQTRNRGTLGGSLCHLDPSAELVSVAAALDATVTVQGRTAAREIAIRAFPVAYMTPAIELERDRDRGALPALAGAPRLRLRGVRPPAWRLRHRVGGGAAHRGWRRQDHARLGHARRHGGGAGARQRGRAGADRQSCRTTSCCARFARPAASSTRSTTCTRRPPIASISRP